MNMWDRAMGYIASREHKIWLHYNSSVDTSRVLCHLGRMLCQIGCCEWRLHGISRGAVTEVQYVVRLQRHTSFIIRSSCPARMLLLLACYYQTYSGNV